MSLKHKVVCISGVFDSGRSEIKKFIEGQGGRVVGSVSSRIDYLVVGQRAGSKADKAKSLGIKMVSLQQIRNIALARDPLEDCYNLANDRARLEKALRDVLSCLGMGDIQLNKIVNDVRACDFTSLHKAIKL